MFLSCGDALFDVFAEPGSEVSRIGLNAVVGGSPLNVALGLARLGHAAGFFTKVSSDLFGRGLRSFMQAEAIDQRFLIPTDRNTTLAIVSLSKSGSAEYSFYIDGTADRSIEPAEVPGDLPQELDAIHVASYSTVTEPTASALVKLIAQEKDRRFISYDPNIRASIEPDLDIWRAKVAEIVPSAALVKASDEDLAQLYPGRSLENVLADWVSAGASLAIVTRGDKGAIALSSRGVSAALDGLNVSVVDTVGAGDTFQAATLAKLKEDGAMSRAGLAGLDQNGLQALLGFAIKAAAVTCTRRGADLPRRGDLGRPPL